MTLELSGKSVLVTGSGGFIGSHLTEELVRMGCKVTSFVRYNSMSDWEFIDTFPDETRKAIEIIPGDLKDSDALRNAMKGKDVVFHLGAVISIPYSYMHPRDVVETNVMGTLNVLMAARDSDVKRIVHTSTSETYGTARTVPISEDHPMQGQSPYSASKIGADKIAESFHCSYGMPIVTLRPFNTYGPRQSARAVIPTIIAQLMKGNKISLGSLEPKRDFTYVSDTVSGFIKAAESDKAVGETINIGSGKEVSVGEVAEKIMSLMGKRAEIEPDEKRVRPEKSEVQRLLCDNSKAKVLMGWEPRVPLEDGLRKTIEWLKDNSHLYKPGVYNV
jgi:NAD dependent epimerase/dehydratase